MGGVTENASTGLAVSQANEMKRITGIDMQFVQPEPEYSEGAFRRCLESVVAQWLGTCTCLWC